MNVPFRFNGKIRVEAFPIPDSLRVRLVAVCPAMSNEAGGRVIVMETQIPCSVRAELDAGFVGFCKEILKTYPGAKIDPVLPNLYSAFSHSRPVPKPDTPPVVSPGVMPGAHPNFGFDPAFGSDGSVVVKKPVETFEVNMMEALVGWKSWIVNYGYLVTRGEFAWIPGKAVEATCDRYGYRSPVFHKSRQQGASLAMNQVQHTNGGCAEIPNLEHSCGIYAADEPDRALQFFGSKEHVFGQIYGWGRYVRGDSGWRSQFAYPKNFVIDESQMPLMDTLRKYHVPIYVRTQTLLFDPAEDGYEGVEDGHRKNEADGNSGSDQESGSAEGDYTG